jgi:hypothetical protein
MKRIIKWPLKLAWKATGPIRRPITRAFEHWLDRYVVMTSHAATEEANIGLDFAAAEMTRMQLQIQRMRESLQAPNRDGLAILP